ncbi:MAG: hypothetical protein ABW321_31105, partial [Polyangiales bacterium]
MHPKLSGTLCLLGTISLAACSGSKDTGSSPTASTGEPTAGTNSQAGSSGAANGGRSGGTSVGTPGGSPASSSGGSGGAARPTAGATASGGSGGAIAAAGSSGEVDSDGGVTEPPTDGGDFDTCVASLTQACGYADKEKSCASVVTTTIPLTDGSTWGNNEIKGGPYGAFVAWNQGASFANPVSAGESTCEFLAGAFGEPPSVTADVLDLRGADL